MSILKVYKKGKLLQTLELDSTQEYLFGRSKECDVILDDTVFSRQHFKLYYNNNTWCVQSLSKYSKIIYNGTELDFFEIRNAEFFSAFDFRFDFEELKIEVSNIESTLEPIIDNRTPTHEDTSDQQMGESNNNLDFPSEGESDLFETEEKTFVPEMASNDWSYGVPFLIIKSNSTKSKTFRLEGDYWVIGREDSCDVKLDEAKASREHFEIYKNQNAYFLTDLGSSNGTYLNNKKLSQKKEVPLKSGDTIQVGQTLIIFEIRDPLFDNKITTLPVEVVTPPLDYNYPAENSEYAQKVIRLPNKKINNSRGSPLLMVLAVLVVGLALFMDNEPEQTTQTASTTQTINTSLSPFDSLSKEQKDYVEKSYNLSKTLYTQGKYELALTEIENVHKLLPEYKDSKEIAQYSKNAIDTLLSQKEIEREEQEQKMQKIKIQQIVSSCEATYLANKNGDQLENCLEPALEIDPENLQAKAILAISDEDDIKKEAQMERQAQLRSQIEKRKNIYLKAEKLKSNGKILDAIATYERHIASAMPDPDNLESRSKQEIQNLKNKLSQETKKLSEEASQAYAQKNYKVAIKKLTDAIRLNPQDSALKDQQNTYSKELTKIVKALYGDSVLEENLGNIDAAKEKWIKIKETDVEYGDYYKKASSKLRKYGM